MRTLILFSFVLLGSLARAERSEFNYSLGLPDKKHAEEVKLPRNPFQAGQEPERPLPVLKDKDDPVAKLPGLVAPRIRSIIREPSPLVMIDGKVFRPGDEILLGKEPPLQKYRVVLKAVGVDQLSFNLTSLDPQQPGQVEAAVPIPSQLK